MLVFSRKYSAKIYLTANDGKGDFYEEGFVEDNYGLHGVSFVCRGV